MSNVTKARIPFFVVCLILILAYYLLPYILLRIIVLIAIAIDLFFLSCVQPPSDQAVANEIYNILANKAIGEKELYAKLSDMADYFSRDQFDRIMTQLVDQGHLLKTINEDDTYYSIIK